MKHYCFFKYFQVKTFSCLVSSIFLSRRQLLAAIAPITWKLNLKCLEYIILICWCRDVRMCTPIWMTLVGFGVKSQDVTSETLLTSWDQKNISCTDLSTHRGSCDWCDHRQTGRDVLQRHATASAQVKSDSSRTWNNNRQKKLWTIWILNYNFLHIFPL